MMTEIHGGDIYRNRVELDFSINVNPLGMPEGTRQVLCQAAESCTVYPDPMAQRLKETVGNSLGISPDFLLFGNGASELFMAMVHGIRPGGILIPVPSFYGYEHAARAAGCQVIYCPLKEEHEFLPDQELFSHLTEDVELLFLANPNNPTGKRMSREYLRRLLAICRERGIFVVLDECFVEFCGPEASMLSEVSRYDNLLLVRAFTKIYGIPGVRLGYLISGNRELLKRIERQLPEWNLSAFAQAAGCFCAGQTEFVRRTAEFVKQERDWMRESLERLGIFVFSGEANFLLLRTEAPLYEWLKDRGILIRDCRNFRGLSEGYYRIAVKTREEQERLLKEIGECIGANRTTASGRD